MFNPRAAADGVNFFNCTRVMVPEEISGHPPLVMVVIHQVLVPFCSCTLLLALHGAGFYGISQNASFSEDSPTGNDYLAEVCREWEAAAKVGLYFLI